MTFLSKSYIKAIGLRSVIRMYEKLLNKGAIKINGSAYNRLNELKLKGYKATND